MAVKIEREPEQLLVSVAHAAKLMDMSEWTVRRLVNKGDLPSVQFMKKGAIRIPYKALQRFVREETRR